MFPAQLTGWVEAARNAAEIEVRTREKSPKPRPEPLARFLSAGWLGTIGGLAACMAVGVTAWLHVSL